MERLMLLWDELDELAGLGRYALAGVAASLARRGSHLRARLRALVPASTRI